MSAITDSQWAEVKSRFDEVKQRYVELLGTPGVAVGPALMITFEPMERRFNSGERTPELFEEMQNVE